jgi:hypothetical protein
VPYDKLTPSKLSTRKFNLLVTKDAVFFSAKLMAGRRKKGWILSRIVACNAKKAYPVSFADVEKRTLPRFPQAVHCLTLFL